MSELSEQNRALIERLRKTLAVSPNTAELLIAAWAQTNALLDAARAEGAQPSISTDGPHAITDTRHWLARQLLDSKLSDQSAFSIVAHAPSIKAARAEGPAPATVTEPMTSKQVRDFAMARDHFAVPVRPGVTVTWTDEETGEVVQRATIKGRNIVHLIAAATEKEKASER